MRVSKKKKKKKNESFFISKLRTGNISSKQDANKE